MGHLFRDTLLNVQPGSSASTSIFPDRPQVHPIGLLEYAPMMM
jgi:hypothetical protein